MKRFTRALVAVTSTALVSAGLAVVGVTPASAAVLPNVPQINPSTGNDQTIFGGSVTGQCPAGTTDVFWDISGPDLPAEQAILAPGANNGVGPQSFSGASIANLKSANAGSFATAGTNDYKIRFNCFGQSSVTDFHEVTLRYTTGGAGSWTIVYPARATETVLSASPAGPYEVGTLTDLTADVTPTTGADDPVGSVEFFNGSTSLGVDNTLSSNGVANLNGVSLPEGSNSLTAVFTPATVENFTGSTSAPVTVQVNPVAPRPTTAVLTVSPDSGPAYQAVTLTCTVTAGTGAPNGTASFTDNGA
ncbi:MAG TPA: Ig-like domain-containing protein, partial [Mycobacteriales bacterium]|nr:Ig-like domain-containing protein [Mycobacteriales bacterium]